MGTFLRAMSACAIALAMVSATNAQAQSLSLIRDSEIEETLRHWLDPILAAAGLEPGAVGLFLVNDRSLNAFVAGGQNLFINTGLLMASDSPDQVIGVMAHEVGHIAGGHLIRTNDAIAAAQDVGLLHTILGIGLIALSAAAGASGGAEAGAAVIAGGQSAATGTFLSYTRSQERAADQAALNYLDRTGTSAKGLLDFFGKLRDQELLVAARQDPYFRTHPLTQDRIAFVEEHVRKSGDDGSGMATDDIERHQRMRAKLIGFLERPKRVMRAYPDGDQSLPARYARALAFFRAHELDEAIAALDTLLAERPEDPFFLELKGQILFESGRLEWALPYYQSAVSLRPDDPLLLTGLAQVQIESGDDSRLDEAIKALERAVKKERGLVSAWRLLAVAYGRTGNNARMMLAAGEQAVLQGRPEDAIRFAERAAAQLPEGSPDWFQAQDIEQVARQQKKKAEKNR